MALCAARSSSSRCSMLSISRRRLCSSWLSLTCNSGGVEDGRVRTIHDPAMRKALLLTWQHKAKAQHTKPSSMTPTMHGEAAQWIR